VSQREVADLSAQVLTWISLASWRSREASGVEAEGEVSPMPRTTTQNGTGRATGVSLAAILLVLACFGAMVVLHVVRTDLDPVRQFRLWRVGEDLRRAKHCDQAFWGENALIVTWM
jgi:hypothetical protein